MVEELKERCSNCKFWYKTEEQDHQDGRGYCRRLPPLVVSNADPLVSSMFGEATTKTVWPRTTHIDWCGEHQFVPVPGATNKKDDTRTWR